MPGAARPSCGLVLAQRHATRARRRAWRSEGAARRTPPFPAAWPRATPASGSGHSSSDCAPHAAALRGGGSPCQQVGSSAALAAGNVHARGAALRPAATAMTPSIGLARWGCAGESAATRSADTARTDPRGATNRAHAAG